MYISVSQSFISTFIHDAFLVLFLIFSSCLFQYFSRSSFSFPLSSSAGPFPNLFSSWLFSFSLALSSRCFSRLFSHTVASSAWKRKPRSHFSQTTAPPSTSRQERNPLSFSQTSPSVYLLSLNFSPLIPFSHILSAAVSRTVIFLHFFSYFWLAFSLNLNIYYRTLKCLVHLFIFSFLFGLQHYPLCFNHSRV